MYIGYLKVIGKIRVDGRVERFNHFEAVRKGERRIKLIGHEVSMTQIGSTGVVGSEWKSHATGSKIGS